MLDWNQKAKIQKKGRKLAKRIRCINVFLQPRHYGHTKNVWDNCALILAEKTDQQLKPYIVPLLEWLQDINWPGAYCIRDRLLRFKDREWIEYCLDECINVARATDDEMWLAALIELQKEYISI